VSKRSRDQVVAQLPKAEVLFRQLKELLFSCSHELARGGEADWERAEALFQLAKSADQLQRNIANVLSHGQRPERSRPARAVAGKQNVGVVRKQSRSLRKDYPKYLVKGNLLFKTGLSRDAQKEYEHVMPKNDFDSIISLLAKYSAAKTAFGVEELRRDLSCPAYQIYTVLSLLKKKGILQVPKRGLYTFKSPGTFPAAAANLWGELQQS
jgi:hypothetical protein